VILKGSHRPVSPASKPGSVPLGPRPVWQPKFPWVPVLLVSLVLVTLLGGLSVGHFYWTDLRPDMGRIGANLAQVRDRQRAMMGHFAEAQALLLEQQRRLLARAEDLGRREQAVYEARLEIDAQRAQIAEALRSRDPRPGTLPSHGAGGVTEIRLTEAANLAQTAAADLGRSDDLKASETALAVASGVLDELPGAEAERGRAALAAARARLAEVRPVDRSAVAKRLWAVRGQAMALRPLGARLLRPSLGDDSVPKAGSSDPVAQAQQTLGREFEAAQVALNAGDGAGFRSAMQGVDRWLSAFYEPWRPAAADVQAQVRALAETPVQAETVPLADAMGDLAAALRSCAATSGDR